MQNTFNSSAAARNERLEETVYRGAAGLPHNENGPAVVRSDGTQQWLRHGVLHREGGPAKILPDGSTLWYFEGQWHRERGPTIENTTTAPMSLQAGGRLVWVFLKRWLGAGNRIRVFLVTNDRCRLQERL